MADGNKSLQLPPYPAQAAPGDYIWVDWWRRLQQFMKDLLNEINKSAVFMGPGNWGAFYSLTVTKNVYNTSGGLINTITESYPYLAGAWTVVQGQFTMSLSGEIPMSLNQEIISASASLGTATTDGGVLYAVPPPASDTFIGSMIASVNRTSIPVSFGDGLGWDNNESVTKTITIPLKAYKATGSITLKFTVQATYAIRTT